ncbi:hypothetical protein M2302_006622 [Micromonospora sp. A200]|uniref:hypothetical protein n=1 Tax=Micromonospora sp. A200 TaxID=2940568 RepID=UPI002473637E|nr:hypothetical protein [Micromonospora sp. A200]MDH6466414.1 hypothetical protein [Micromonospora sp. A200]
MGDVELIGHELIEPCLECGALTAGEVTETIDGDRLAWAVSTRCGGCGSAVEVDGWGEMPGIVREALIARVGLVRLQADPAASGRLRVRLLAAFRKGGATISDAAGAYTALTGLGITGTPSEMRLLADRLTAAGATVLLTPQVNGR